MCHGQQNYGWWNQNQNWQDSRGTFWQQRGNFRPFRPFWFGRHGMWNSKYREYIEFNDEKNQVEISIEVPGIAKEKIKVKANKEFLYVSIDDRENDQDHPYERRYPFRLQADLTKIKPKYSNGLLTIEIPLLESEKQDINIE